MRNSTGQSRQSSAMYGPLVSFFDLPGLWDVKYSVPAFGMIPWTTSRTSEGESS